MVHVKQNYHHYNLKQDTLVRKWRMEKLKTRWCVNKVSQISSRTVASNTYEAIANWKVVRFMDKISVRASTQETVLEEAHSYKPIPLILSGRKVMDSKIKKKKLYQSELVWHTSRWGTRDKLQDDNQSLLNILVIATLFCWLH